MMKTLSLFIAGIAFIITQGSEVLKKTTVIPSEISSEYISFDDIKINDQLHLLSNKESVYKLLGKPDSVIDPDLENTCGSYFDKNFKLVYFGANEFEASGNKMILRVVNFGKESRIRLSLPQVVLDNTFTLERFSKMFPQSAKNKTEVVVDKIGTVVSVKLSTSKTGSSDDAWLLFFKSGRLVRFDYWIPC